MWGKRDLAVFWITAYLPFLMIMIYRFIDSNDFFKETKFAHFLAKYINKILFDGLIVILIIGISLVLYRTLTNWYFNSLEKELKEGISGTTYSIREYKRISVNDYSFFLITLLLPLVSIDHSSIMNLIVTSLIIAIVIAIFVKTDFISACPLFFTSGRHVYKAIISQHSKEEEENNPSLRMSVLIIIKEKKPNLNYKFKGEKLIEDIFYFSEKP